MNQGRIWCVVNPTIGLPLFLGSVATISLIVHAAVLSNASWYKGFYNGKPIGEKTALKASTSSQLASAATPGYTVKVTPVENGNGAINVTVTPANQAVASAAPVSGGSPPAGQP
jgi:light-harvesting protein B-800-850 alpha chain